MLDNLTKDMSAGAKKLANNPELLLQVDTAVELNELRAKFELYSPIAEAGKPIKNLPCVQSIHVLHILNNFFFHKSVHQLFLLKWKLKQRMHLLQVSKSLIRPSSLSFIFINQGLRKQSTPGSFHQVRLVCRRRP